MRGVLRIPACKDAFPGYCRITGRFRRMAECAAPNSVAADGRAGKTRSANISHELMYSVSFDKRHSGEWPRRPGSYSYRKPALYCLRIPAEHARPSAELGHGSTADKARHKDADEQLFGRRFKCSRFVFGELEINKG